MASEQIWASPELLTSPDGESGRPPLDPPALMVLEQDRRQARIREAHAARILPGGGAVPDTREILICKS